ncbi:hypothetical protein [Streptomyces clavuligerus]|uniref:hypothetical protein n=1 Tax=Streptomyces clavuligerus TaxID=1901 RepID=UPI000AB690C8|nr:hypothetical protein [Streptomyces clavuligerus]
MTTPSSGTPATTPTTTPPTPPTHDADKAMLDGPTPKDLLPSTGNYPTEVVRYQSVVLTDIPGAAPGRALTGAIDLGEENLPFYDRPAEGMVVTTEQSWSAQGVTLGRLLHSLALAPGESTRVAVVDWQRTTRATGAETAGENELLTGSTDQNRSISEVANAIAREEQHGSSQGFEVGQSSSEGGSVGGSLGVVFSGGGNWSKSSNFGIASTVSRSTGVRSVAQEATQRISARTQQLATAARSRNMTVVRETSQAEKDQVMTRVVTNYNHMHAMSVQYYEVVQVYTVTTKPTRLERCLFIPLQELTFTHTSLQRYKDVLASVAPADWATKIRAANPFDTAVRRLDACAAPEVPTTQEFAGVELADVAASAMGVYGVRKADGSPVKFDPATQQWKPLPTTGLSGSLTRIAPGKDTVWAIRATDNMVVQFDGTTWRADGWGGYALRIVCATDGTVYVIGTNNAIHQRGQSSWTNLGVTADDIAVTGKDKLWYSRQGLLYERSGISWVQRGGPGVQRLSATSDGALWAVVQSQSSTETLPLLVESGATTAVRPTAGGLQSVTGLAQIASVGGGDYWVLMGNGTVRRILGREALVAFDDQPKEDSAYASRIDVWSDSDGIRGIQVVHPSHTFGCGDIGGSGAQQASYTFGGADKLLSYEAWSGRTARGSLAGLRLKMTSGVANFGIAATTTVAADLSEDAGGGSAICGLFGSTVRSGSRTYVASLGFHVRGGNVPQPVLDHLNDNRRHYSQAVWANADELTLSRILANYSYTPAGSSAGPVPLGMLLDPKPIAATGNYLGFRWNFASEQEREAWTAARRPADNTFGTPVADTIAIATNGVFAEAVLGRSNSAEKIDLTRFWNWKDSPIQITPADIAPVSTASRAQNLDTTAAGMGVSQAKFTPLVAMPDPVGLQTTQAIATANLFRDMSGLDNMSQFLTKGIEAAAGNDKEAGMRAQEAMKTATEHAQKMAQIAVDALGKVLPLATGGAAGGGGSISALGGMLNQGAKAAAPDKKADTPSTDGTAAKS